MGKRRVQAVGGQSNKSSSNAMVDSPDRFIKDLEQVIRANLNIRNVGFSSQVIAGNKKVYALNSPLATLAEAKYPYHVVRFLDSDTQNYWLGLSLEMEFIKGEHFLSDISLLVFEGDATDNAKRALLRAEWSQPREKDRARHAQPHWHVYANRFDEITIAQFLEIDLAREPKDFNPQIADQFPPRVTSTKTFSEWDRGEKFHFAMASRWHILDRNSHQENIQATQVLKWVDGCLSYTREQLKFLNGNL